MVIEFKLSFKLFWVVVVVIDNSEYVEKVFDCEYSFIYFLSIFYWKIF